MKGKEMNNNLDTTLLDGFVRLQEKLSNNY